MTDCPCPQHPTGCYGHPDKCGCADLARPIIGIENRTAQEVFDMMCDRIIGRERRLRAKGGDNG